MRVCSEVTNDIEVRISSDHVGCERLSRAGEDLNGSWTDTPVEFEAADTKVDCVGGSGDTVRVQGMAPGGLADGVLVRGVNVGYEGTLALKFQGAQLGESRQGRIAGPPALCQGTLDACAHRFNASASKVPDGGELGCYKDKGQASRRRSTLYASSIINTRGRGLAYLSSSRSRSRSVRSTT